MRNRQMKNKRTEYVWKVSYFNMHIYLVLFFYPEIRRRLSLALSVSFSLVRIYSNDNDIVERKKEDEEYRS